jgi:hypothetical protein
LIHEKYNLKPAYSSKPILYFSNYLHSAENNFVIRLPSEDWIPFADDRDYHGYCNGNVACLARRHLMNNIEVSRIVLFHELPGRSPMIVEVLERYRYRFSR